MVSYFRKRGKDGEIEPVRFNRFHLAEARGGRVLTVAELPDISVELTFDEAYRLIDAWNAPGSDEEYFL